MQCNDLFFCELIHFTVPVFDEISAVDGRNVWTKCFSILVTIILQIKKPVLEHICCAVYCWIHSNLQEN